MTKQAALMAAQAYLRQYLEKPAWRAKAERALKELEGVEQMTDEQAEALYDRIIEEDKKMKDSSVDRLPVQSLENVFDEHGPRRETWEDTQRQRWREECQGFLDDVRGNRGSVRTGSRVPATLLGAVVRDKPLVVTEGISGFWHYHLSVEGSPSRGLCGAWTMPTSLPLSGWNRRIPHYHIPESFCSKCEAARLARKQST